MPKCKNNSKKYYKGTEPSPKGLGICSQTLKEGTKKKGKDGNMWIVKKIKNGQLRWIKFKNDSDDYRIVNVTLNNLKKYNTLDSGLGQVNFKYEISIILKNKDRKGVFLIKNDVIIGFYHLLLKPILQLVFITISKNYRGKKLCSKLIKNLIEYIQQKNINILKIVNASGLSALKCYYHLNKLNYNIFYKNDKDEWEQINKSELIPIGKKMIEYDAWMVILFIKNKLTDEIKSLVD